MKKKLLRCLQWGIIVLFRPYIVRELPGWWHLFALCCNYDHDKLWVSAPTLTVRGKWSKQLMRLDLSNWPDRAAFFLGRWYDTETQLLASAVLEPGDTVVDIGANRGLFALYASSLVGSEGHVICFEPNPECVEILKHDMDANRIRNIEVHNIGLGDQNHELVLTSPLRNSGEATFGVSTYSASEVRQVRVPVKRGDILLGDVTPSMIKIDTEGYEPKVLAGLTNTIQRSLPVILTEVVPEHLNSCGSSVSELVTLMTGHGYQGFKPGLTTKDGEQKLILEKDWDRTSACDVVWIPSTTVNRFAQYLV